MHSKPQKVVYVKPSFQGIGCIPLGTQGKVLIYVEHPVVTKLLVDFYPYCKAIVPLNSVKRVEE